MAMPWSKAKEKARRLLEGPREDRARLTALFDACFRIQCEAIEAAGHFIPLVVENVRGAQPWVGRARWNFGSFYLFGDVPALMPTVRRGDRKSGIGSWDPTRANYTSDHAWKSQGMNWSDRTKHGQDFTRPAGEQAIMKEGVKQRGSGREWFAGDGKISRMTSSNSNARKAASAMIAKIPFVLSSYIAKVYHPDYANGGMREVPDTNAAGLLHASELSETERR